MITAAYGINEKVNELLGRMTLEEKVAQLQSCWMYDLQTHGVLDENKVKLRFKHGIGQVTRIGGASTYPPREIARVYNQLQRYLVEKTRLGIPAINHEECCSGLMVPRSSIFPQMIGLASTFEPDLARQLTTSIRKQMLAVGARQGLAPVLDVGRDPRWGRIEETFGEDPTLVSQFGVSYIRGLQGENLQHGVMATAKHFVGHAFSQGGLNCGPVHLGWRDLWDIYLGPFEAAIREAGLATVMNAYPELDGEVVAASRRILTDLLRDKLGFDGLVVSDYEAIIMIHNYHAMAKNRREAAVLALNAGIDVECPTVACYGEDLFDALKSGELSIETVDLSVSRHLQKKFELGLFENPYVDEGSVPLVLDTKEDRELAYQLAAKSLVLLKNDGVLPLTQPVKKIALIGPNADNKRCMMGDYSYAAVVELLQVTPAEDSSFNGISEQTLDDLTVAVLTLRESLQQRLNETELLYAKGCEINSEDESLFAEAEAAAHNADLVILAMGGRSGLHPTSTTGEFRDASDLGLPGKQAELIKRIQGLGKSVVLVILDGRPAAIPDLVNKCNAILLAWVPGEEGAAAIVDTLTGKMNPGGKLPLSIPRSAGQVPVFYNHKPSGMRSNIYGDYYNEKVTPLFPFGHGLSYTQFQYADLRVSPQTVSAGGVVDISLTVKNCGDVRGEEVVQLYLRDFFASMPRPVKELKGFIRLSLEPGESRRVMFHLPINQMAFYDAELSLVLEPGSFLAMVGSSSEDIRLYQEFEVAGTRAVVGKREFYCPVELK